MALHFRTFFAGKVKKLGNQWVETRFMIIGVAFIGIFIPVESVLVTKASFGKREGIDIPLNGKSVLTAYAKVLSGMGTIVFSVLTFDSLVTQDKDMTLLFIGCLGLSIVTYIYFRSYFGRPDEAEVEVRSRLGRAIGLYARPEWLNDAQAIDLIKSIQLEYRERHQSDWRVDIASHHIPYDKVPLLFALALFDYIISPDEENGRLLKRVEALYHV